MNRFTKKPKDDGAAILAAMKKSDKEAFLKAVKEVVADGAGKVSIMCREKVSDAAGELEEIPVSDVATDENFFETVRKKWKDGIYTFKLWKEDESVHSEHHFGIGDLSAKTKKKGGKGKKGKGSKNFQEQLTLRLIDKAFESKTSDADQFQRTLELAKSLKGDNGITAQDMMNFGLQIAGVLQGQGGGTLDEAVTLLDLMQRLQPQQQQDEGWGQLVPMVTSLIASFKQGQGGLTSQQAQDIQALKQQLQGVTPGAVAAPQGAAGQPAAPGAITSGSGLGGAVEPPSSPQAPARLGTEAYFHERFLNPFRRDVAAGEKDDELAYQIVTMTIYARDRMADNLPLIVADFVNASTMADYEAALQKFYAAIPELANLTQRQIGIRTALIMNYMSGFVESPEEEAEVAHDSHSIIHIDQDQSVEEASIHDAHSGVIDEADAQERTGDEGLPANAPDHSQVRHENVSSEV